MRLRSGVLAGLVCAVAIGAAVAISGVSQGSIDKGTVAGAAPWLSLYSLAVKADGTAFVVGSKATLLVSSDHGKSWNEQILTERPGGELFQDRDLYSIKFTPDGNDGWIVGEKGLIMHSGDGGKTWSNQQSGTAVNLLQVATVDGQHAYACGADGVTLYTVDGGAHWNSVVNKGEVTFFDITYTDANDGWVVGEFELIEHTTDGGKSWQVVNGGNMTDFTIGPYFSIVFTSPESGVAAGLNGDIVTTSDGGKSWQKQKLPDDVATYAAFADKGQLWLGGEGGRLFNMQNGKWVVYRPTFNDITDIAFSGNFGFAVGLNGTILRTDDAGEQWQAVK